MIAEDEELENKFVCIDCIKEQFLREEIKANNQKATCSYCGETNESISLGDLSEKVKYVLDNYFSITSIEPEGFEYYMAKDKESNYSWGRHGIPIVDTIQDFLNPEESIAKDIQKYLDENDYSREREEMQEEGPYDEDAHYEEADLKDEKFKYLWQEFKGEILKKKRFFNERATDILDEIFANINSHDTYKQERAIKTIKADEKQILYRARLSQSFNKLSKILKNPVLELASPPPNYATNGRMNSVGISMFYGALDKDTCVSEVRPPVGSSVVLGKFQLVQDIRVLDFDILTKIQVKESPFSPDYAKHCSLKVFLKEFISELCKPVMPGKESFEYIPTQVIAEYLATKVSPKLDGILFNSTQHTDGKNIVLFNHAISVMPCKMPKEEHVRVEFAYDGDPEENITCINVVDETPSKSKIVEIAEDKDTTQYTLRLNLKDIEVLRIESVKFNYLNEEVNRYSFDIENCTDF